MVHIFAFHICSKQIYFIGCQLLFLIGTAVSYRSGLVLTHPLAKLTLMIWLFSEYFFFFIKPFYYSVLIHSWPLNIFFPVPVESKFRKTVQTDYSALFSLFPFSFSTICTVESLLFCLAL